MSAPDDIEIIRVLEDLALAAGREIIAVRDAGFTVDTKKDQTPVTCADRRSEDLIVAGLRHQFPSIPYVAEEETASRGACDLPGDVFFLVDALDGTKEFVTGRPDFTVNIAMVRQGVPVLGVVYAPAHKLLFSGWPGHAEEAAISPEFDIVSRERISVRPSEDRRKIVSSRAHCTPETEAFISRYPDAEIITVGSSLKFCMLARGDADLYPRFGPTMEWDTAAGDAVLRAAGGRTRLVGGEKLIYGKCDRKEQANFTNPSFISDARSD